MSSSASSSISSLPLITVFGVTGAQGGSVLSSLLSSGKYRVRGVTRDPLSEKSKLLLAKYSNTPGLLELVKADLSNVNELESVFKGAWGVFLVTNFWDPSTGSKNEFQQGKNAADVALKEGVKYFIYSSLVNAVKISNGRRHVDHFTLKNQIESYIRSLSFPLGSSFFYAGCYQQNFLSMMSPRKNPKDGVWEFSNIIREDVEIPWFNVEKDTGKSVLYLFNNYKEYNGKILRGGLLKSYLQAVESFTKGTGQPCRYNRLPEEIGKSFGEEIYDMFMFFNENGYYGGDAPSREFFEINELEQGSLEEFFKKNAKQFV